MKIAFIQSPYDSYIINYFTKNNFKLLSTTTLAQSIIQQINGTISDIKVNKLKNIIDEINDNFWIKQLLSKIANDDNYLVMGITNLKEIITLYQNDFIIFRIIDNEINYSEDIEGVGCQIKIKINEECELEEISNFILLNYSSLFDQRYKCGVLKISKEKN